MFVEVRFLMRPVKGFIMTKLTIPANYNILTQTERRKVREKYNSLQKWKCCHCGSDLQEQPSKEIMSKAINLKLFPIGFLKNPIHLHHNHKTGMTIGSVHARCNAVLWQYHGE